VFERFTQRARLVVNPADGGVSADGDVDGAGAHRGVTLAVLLGSISRRM